MIATAPATPAFSPAARRGWDSYLFVLNGDDRAALADSAVELLGRIESDPDADAFDLASSLAGGWSPGGRALAIVATSLSDLQAKLRRAVERLARPDCKMIRDAAGIYFSDCPLYREGTLALLFPGEGAQYPDMLADLCELFPEVAATFHWCDQLAADAGRPEDSLRRILHLPEDASPDERAAAESQLRRLGPSIFGVLVADLAISRVLRELGLPVSAVAGHSAGELAALLAAGAIPPDAFLGTPLTSILDMMQQQEDEAGGADVLLLAVGAGKAVVEGIAAGVVAGETTFIAMDNCPHQCVAVGPDGPIAKVESEILARGIVCERLPFHRPYHTPLFEPWMGPFRELFAGIPFQSPHTPVYCCSTGQLFPADGAAIRDLAVNHWVSPVEFSRLIETMYADGVRLFVEAGPRGNLSAFTEDILRGRPFASVPANLPRKSGPMQLNHLIGQLAVHGVPVRLSRLFWSEAVGEEQGEREQAKEFREQGTGDGRRAEAVMNGYLDVMEQFLGVQRSVMESFLRGPAGCDTALAPSAFSIPDFAAFSLDGTPVAEREEVANSSAYALIEEVVEFEPGQSIVVRRTLDENEDLFADDHTLAGRGVSRVDPGQNGLPILPMTFSLEGMAEAALLLAPGKVVVAIRDVRLFRWVPFDPEPTTLEIRAAITDVDPETGIIEVKADVRDLGNSFIKDGANKPAAEAVVVLADNHPEPHKPLSFSLTNERACSVTIDVLRRNMFHGPLFQMLRSLDRHGDEGIEGTLEVHPRNGWFRSNPDPTVVIDPVLVDAAMHILGAWHLEQPDWTGRILLPFEVRRIDFFGPPPDAGTRLLIRGHNEQASARHFRHGVEMMHEDGRLWLRMTGVGYWRFYLPFGHVNFFGPKDEYYLSREWPEAVLPRADGHPGRCYFLDPPADLKQPVLRAAGARVTMTPRELKEFRGWTGTDNELNDWFFGRMLAKDAVRAAWMAVHGAATFPADIESEENEDRIVCRPRLGEQNGHDRAMKPYPPVSIAIVGGRVAAYSAFADRVGIALLTLSAGENETAVRQRAACLAVADALNLSVEEMQAKLIGETGEFLVSWPGESTGVLVQTSLNKEFVAATTRGEKP